MLPKPNLIFILCDQLRADFLSAYDASFISTPHIDSLAEHGVLYSQAYSSHPLCVPARVSLLTGMDALKNGVLSNGFFLRPDYHRCGLRTWPEILAQNGYYTAAIGKMHFYPWDAHLGFRYRSIAEDKRWIHIRDDYYHFLRQHGYRKLHGREHEGYFENKGAIISKIPWEYSIDHFVGQEACRFIRTFGREGPFAMMIGFPGPHCPYDPSPEFLAKIDPSKMPTPIPEVPTDTPQLRQRNIEGNRLPWNGVDYTTFTPEQKRLVRAHYAALVKQIDYEIGQILTALQEEGLEDDTVIIFTSDHGDYLGDHGLIGKGSFFETSIHIPLLVRLPWAKGPSTNNELVTLSDVTATILELAHCSLPPYMDAIPLPGLGLRRSQKREWIIGSLAGGWMIYDGQWRLAKYATGERVLFNLLSDPWEQDNLVNQPKYQKIYSRLDSLLTQEILRSQLLSYHDRLVYARDLSQEPSFGYEGWQRPYPRDIHEAL
ncbi:MAG: sulfatase-like hydrolase/transferase [Anaerolineae bacterium]|nr:sulfatase-like hydrolase/transferase [Anaerolineae bacterium]